MEISAAKKDFSVWCPFGEDARVQIRHISRQELRKLYLKATTIEFVKGAKVEKLDPAKADQLLGRSAVLDWEGFTDGGVEFPCTAENIDILMKGYNAFARFVNDMCVDLDALVEAEKEVERKNSGSMSSPGLSTGG